MSKVNACVAPSIPIGIPVTPPPKVAPSQRPTPKRKAARSAIGPAVPWLWIVTGGSLAWAGVVLTIGLSCGRTEPVASVDPSPTVKLVAVANPMAEQPEKETPFDGWPSLDEPGLEAPPRVEPKPKRPAPEQVVEPGVYEMPPMLEPAPADEPKPVPPRAGKPARPARIDADPAIFASCNQVGTDILFMKSPPDAFKKAREEKKLVFFVHLSGNLEDPGFT